MKIAEIPDIEVDPITLDIIENALRHARFEMDAVLFRSAMSPVIREQHDEFPMLTDPQGRMVVDGPAVVEQYDATVVVLEGHVAKVDEHANLLISPRSAA